MFRGFEQLSSSIGWRVILVQISTKKWRVRYLKGEYQQICMFIKWIALCNCKLFESQRYIFIKSTFVLQIILLKCSVCFIYQLLILKFCVLRN